MEHGYAPPGMQVDVAEKVAAILQTRLVDLIDLSLTVKHVHWNVVGPGFITLHELMDHQAQIIRELIDDIAERITTLGGVAVGLPGSVVEKRTADDDYALGRAPVLSHLGALDKRYEHVCERLRDSIMEISERDAVSEGLLLDHSRQLEKEHWFIRAHLVDGEGRLVTRHAATELDAATSAQLADAPARDLADLADKSEPEPASSVNS